MQFGKQSGNSYARCATALAAAVFVMLASHFQRRVDQNRDLLFSR